MTWTEQEATAFFAELFHGEHHIPGKLKPWGKGWSLTTFVTPSTFDFDELTRLVFLAHEHRVRVEISPASPKYLRISAWKRPPLEDVSGSVIEGHPSLEQAVDKWKTARHSSWIRYLSGKLTVGEASS